MYLLISGTHADTGNHPPPLPITAGKLKAEGGEGAAGTEGRGGEPKLTLDIQYGQVLNWPGPS